MQVRNPSEKEHMRLTALKNAQDKLVVEILDLIKQTPIKKVFNHEYVTLKELDQIDVLQCLWTEETSAKMSFELWSGLKDLDVAVLQGDLDKVAILLEDEKLKAMVASNNNRVLRMAAIENKQQVVEYLLSVDNVRLVANQISLIHSKAEQLAISQFSSLLRSALTIKQCASDYLKIIRELVREGNITDLDWKYLPNILNVEQVPDRDLNEVASFLTVLPSVRMRAQQDADFRDLLFKTKAWVKGEETKPKLREVPRMGPYVVKLGVSAFNLVAYEKFLEEKAQADKLREHFTESELQQYYPERFPPKARADLFHSITIENNKITYNGVKPGKRN